RLCRARARGEALAGGGGCGAGGDHGGGGPAPSCAARGRDTARAAPRAGPTRGLRAVRAGHAAGRPPPPRPPAAHPNRDPSAPPPPPALARLGAQQHTARVSSARLEGAVTTAARAVEFYANDWITWRARSLGGTHGAVSDAWRVASNLTRSHAAMRALGVVYMSAHRGPPWD